MIGHIGVNISDLSQAKSYYDELMPLVGFEPFLAADDQFAYWRSGGKPGTLLFFYPALEPGEYSRDRVGLQHLAFTVESRAAVDRVHEWAQQQGAEVLHAPRGFPEYTPDYYATFWIGPDGFMLEAVCFKAE